MNTPRLKPRTLAPPESWLEEWIAPLLDLHIEIEQVYLLGDRARGPQGQKPDYSLLFYAGYDNALELLMSLAREEERWRTSDGILHVYVENYGATFCGIWGGALIPNGLNRDWRENDDYLLWIDRGDKTRSLSDRLRMPFERRKGDRRRREAAPEPTRDDLPPLFSSPPSTEDRRANDRRREMSELQPLLK
jgi:hypothetical protein